jgi:hypothetical protein
MINNKTNSLTGQHGIYQNAGLSSLNMYDFVCCFL